MARHRMAGRGVAWRGKAWIYGVAWRVKAWHGKAWIYGKAGLGRLRQGLAEVRIGKAWHGFMVRRGMVMMGGSRRGLERIGMVRQGFMAWICMAWRSLA